ncbi:MAG: HAD family phosphatase [Oscillibacter sp.]|jgi:hypothetical protein|nr:HAD family phosphatase [Oscillibacter sp.]
MQTGYSVVFLDIDGTLLNSNHQVPPGTKRFLNQLENTGVPVVLCSARYQRGVELIAKETGLHSPVVCLGGSLILSGNRSILYDAKIETSFAVKFKHFVQDRFSNIAISIYLYGEWFTDNLSHPLVRRDTRILQNEPLYGNLETVAQSMPQIHKLQCVGEPSQILQIQQEAASQFWDMDFLGSGDGYLEVMKKGVSKCEAVKFLQKHYHLQTSEIVACGDQFVDMEMLRYAGLGVAMGNAPIEVKAAADLVTTSNDEEGIYIALRNLPFHPPRGR